MNAMAPVPLWMRAAKDLTESEKRWMQHLSQLRVKRYGALPPGDEWQRQMAEIAAAIKAERAGKGGP